MEEEHKSGDLQILGAQKHHLLVICVDLHDSLRQTPGKNSEQDRCNAGEPHGKAPDLPDIFDLSCSPVLCTEDTGSSGNAETENVIQIIILIGKRSSGQRRLTQRPNHDGIHQVDTDIDHLLECHWQTDKQDLLVK